MEGSAREGSEHGGSSESLPPNPLAGAYRQCFDLPPAASPCKRTLVRHASLVKTKMPDVSPVYEKIREHSGTEFVPVVRSGSWADIGLRPSMEDAYVCCDNLIHEYGFSNFGEGPNAFYGILMDMVESMLLTLLAATCQNSSLRMKAFPGTLRGCLLQHFCRLTLL